jgi:hypothetical protein
VRWCIGSVNLANPPKRKRRLLGYLSNVSTGCRGISDEANSPCSLLGYLMSKCWPIPHASKMGSMHTLSAVPMYST